MAGGREEPPPATDASVSRDRLALVVALGAACCWASRSSTSTASGLSSTSRRRSLSSPFCQAATTSEPTPLPITLVMARASDMNRSMPTISAMPTAGMAEWASKACSEAARVTRPAPVTPAAPLRGDQHEQQQADLDADRHVVAGGLGDEDRAHGQVDAGAVEVERVAGRDGEAHDRLLRARRLQLDHHARQHRLAGRRAEHDQDLVLDVAQELEEAEARELRDEAEHDDDEQDAGGVERAHQPERACRGRCRRTCRPCRRCRRTRRSAPRT